MNAASTIDRREVSALERAAHAVGTRLVTWSERRTASVAAPVSASDAVVASVAAAASVSASSAATAAGSGDREVHELRRAAARQLQVIEAERDLGIHRLLR